MSRVGPVGASWWRGYHPFQSWRKTWSCFPGISSTTLSASQCLILCMRESPLGMVEQQVCGSAVQAQRGGGRRAGAVPAHAAAGAGGPRRVGQRSHALWRTRDPLRGRPGAEGPRVRRQRPAGAPLRSGRLPWPDNTLACKGQDLSQKALVCCAGGRDEGCWCSAVARVAAKPFASMRASIKASMRARLGRPAGLHPGRQLDRLRLDAALLGRALPRRGPHAR
jgi:hypothetical protein